MTKSTPSKTSEINIHEILEHRLQIAVIWSVEDVQEVRPDLTEEQAWEVLQTCEKRHDCEQGITWFSLEWVANDLFPASENI